MILEPAIKESIVIAQILASEWFPWFETTKRKNRINFLELLRGEKTDYVLSNEARSLYGDAEVAEKIMVSPQSVD